MVPSSRRIGATTSVNSESSDAPPLRPRSLPATAPARLYILPGRRITLYPAQPTAHRIRQRPQHPIHPLRSPLQLQQFRHPATADVALFGLVAAVVQVATRRPASTGRRAPQFGRSGPRHDWRLLRSRNSPLVAAQKHRSRRSAVARGRQRRELTIPACDRRRGRFGAPAETPLRRGRLPRPQPRPRRRPEWQSSEPGRSPQAGLDGRGEG